MFSIGDLVVYGNTGVCKVEDIGPSTLSGAEKDKDYYFLSPCYSGKTRIMIPCDNDRIVIRAIISSDEAHALIDDVANIDLIDISDEKKREQIYKETIRSCDCRQMFGLIKTIYERKQTRLAEGKKITSSDEKYFMMAEDKLYGELAIVLGIEKNDIRDYIKSKAGMN